MKISKAWTLMIYTLIVTLAIIFILANDSDSHLLIKFGRLEIQARLWSLILFLSIFIPIVSKLWRLMTNLISGKWLSNHLSESSQRKLKQGLLFYLDGDWYSALSRFKTLNNRNFNTPNIIALIVGAKAAEKLENRELCDQWLEKAIHHTSAERQISARLARIKIYIGRQLYQEALKFIDDLEIQFHDRPEVLRLKVICLLKLNKWKGLQQLLDYKSAEIDRIFGAAKKAKISSKLQRGLAEKPIN